MKAASCPARYLHFLLCNGQSKSTAPAAAQTAIYESVVDIPLSNWYGLIPPSLSYLRYDYLAALEAAFGEEMEFRYVLFSENEQVIGFAYFQIFRVGGDQLEEFTETKGPQSFFQKLGYNLAKFIEGQILRPHHRLLLSGNAFLSGAYGYYFHPNIAAQDAHHRLMQAIDSLCRSEAHVFGTLVKDLPVASDHHQPFLNNRFHGFEVEPNMNLALDPSWHTMDDYLNAMHSKYRQRARSAYKKSKPLNRVELSLTEILAHEERLYELYCEVLKPDRFNLKTISKTYFSALKRQLGDRFYVRGYFLNGEIVAFSSMIDCGEMHEAHFIGYETARNHEYKLYQRMLYDFVEAAIKGKAESLALGRTAMAIKSTVGATAEPLSLYLRMKSPFLNRLIRPLLNQVTVEDWVPRNPFKVEKELV